MQYMLDTGILLRLFNRQSADHGDTRDAVNLLKEQGHECLTCLQVLCEFWNVCTRPMTARGGLGLTLRQTQRHVRAIEQITTLLPDSPSTVHRWKELINAHHVSGVHVHDCRLVALMDVHGVTRLLTWNPSDFTRYSKLLVVTPRGISQTPPPAA